MKIMCNKYNNHKVAVSKGFSWTTLFFGVLVPVWRNDLKGFLLMFIAAIGTGGLSWFVFPFFYNNMYIASLRKKGYYFLGKEESIKVLPEEEIKLRKEINLRSFKIAFTTILFFIIGLLVLFVTPVTGAMFILFSIFCGIGALIYNGYCYYKISHKRVR